MNRIVLGGLVVATALLAAGCGSTPVSQLAASSPSAAPIPSADPLAAARELYVPGEATWLSAQSDAVDAETAAVTSGDVTGERAAQQQELDAYTTLDTTLNVMDTTVMAGVVETDIRALLRDNGAMENAISAEMDDEFLGASATNAALQPVKVDLDAVANDLGTPGQFTVMTSPPSPGA